MTDANMRFPQGGISITALAADFAVMMFKGSLPCRLPFFKDMGTEKISSFAYLEPDCRDRDCRKACDTGKNLLLYALKLFCL